MKVRLGYVAIAKTIDDISYNHTITYHQYQKLSVTEQNQRLDHIIRKNLHNLLLVLKYNVQNNITFFRFSHNLIPLATHKEVSFDYITPYQKEWKEIGNFIKKHQLRVDSHPDQFCVLNSINAEVVENSIRMLEFQYAIYQAMGIEGLLILHIGSSMPNKQSACERFVNTFSKLPSYLKKMIVLENDDKTFTVKDTLSLCQKLDIPMVLDYHHYRCNSNKERLDLLLEPILKTWKGKKIPPKMHFSSPKSRKEKRAHHLVIDAHQFISFVSMLISYHTDIDIMLECKGKDESLFRLSRQLQFFTNYQFLNVSTFLVND